MKIEFKSTIICLAFSFCALNSRVCLGQGTGKEADSNEAGIAFEQALKNYEAYRQKEQDEVAKNLSMSLHQETEDWIAQAKNKKEDSLGARIKQNWEKLALSFPISPSHYEYYLRGYKYSVIRKDVAKSDSITSPYKATASIKEELYVEKNHSPGISDPAPYFYTVTTVYNLNFEYRQNKLELINTDSKIIAIENTAPDEIRKRSL